MTDVEINTSPTDTRWPSDHSLLVQLRGGKQDAATALYLRYAKRLASLARKQTAASLAVRFDPDDIVQSVFRTFFRRAAAGQYDIPAGEELWRLFLVIALHKIRDTAAFHRAAKRDVGTTLGSAALERSLSSESVQDETALATLRLVIDEILGQLPEVTRKMAADRIAGYDVSDISRRSGRSKRSVERLLQQFRTKLRRALELEMGRTD